MTTIKDVSKMTGLTTYSLRFYEKEGLLKVPRTPSGIRNYDQDSIDAANAIAHYRNVGMSLEDIRCVFKNYHNHCLSVEMLEKTKRDLDNQIAELEQTREYLIHKIGIHRHLADLDKQQKDNQTTEVTKNE